MKDLSWSSTLSVYVDEVDDDHRKLVGLFNMFMHAVADGDSVDYQRAALEELIACTAWHFRHEERLMVKYGYPDLDEHRKEHLDLIDAVDELRGRFLAPGRQITDDDIEYLEHWLVGHILTMDMKLGDFLVDAM